MEQGSPALHPPSRYKRQIFSMQHNNLQRSCTIPLLSQNYLFDLSLDFNQSSNPLLLLLLQYPALLLRNYRFELNLNTPHIIR